MALSIVTAAKRRNVLGYKHLEHIGNGPQSAMADFLKFLAKRDVVFEFDDFAYATLDATFWVTNALTGGTAFAVPGTPLTGGAITGATGTDGTAGNRVVNLYGSRIYQGDKNCGMEARLKVGAAASNIEWGVGFIDTHTTITTPVVLAADIDNSAPLDAAGLGDAAVVYQDSVQTLTTAALCTLGSTPYTSQKVAIGTFAPTAATYFTARVQLNGDNVYAAVEDANGGYTEANIALGIEGGTLVRPFLVISGPTNTTKTWDVDYIARWEER